MSEYGNIQGKESGEIKVMEESLKDGDDETFNNKGVNKPVLTDGMIPIKYKDGKWVITNQYDDEWYEYKDVGNLAWANVMLSDGKYKWSDRNNKEATGYYTDDGTTVVDTADLGSMFVWIPRFAYSINSYHTASNKEEGTVQEIFDVTFINGTGNKDFEGNEYDTTYSLEDMDSKVGEKTPKIVHPAFKNAKGIWIAKFEASMAGENPNTYENNKVADNELRVLPDKNTWRYINIGNAFLNCYNMQKSGNVYGLSDSKVDSHMIMNSEWGAVAYLSASQYGYVPSINSNGSLVGTSGSVYNEYSGGNNYITYVSQSTTHNQTGVYDMCGGGWEFVAAYYNNQNGNITNQGTTNVFNENKTVKEEYKKYWEVYEVSNDEIGNYKETGTSLGNLDKSYNKDRIEVTKVRYENMKKNLGDAMYEVIGTEYSFLGKNTSGNESWLTKVDGDYSLGYGFYNRDYALIGNCAQPFVFRGGNWVDGNGSGVFTLSGVDGGSYYNRAFRPVLVV